MSLPFHRVFLALWVSLALHAALIGLVRVSPRVTVVQEPVLDVRLDAAAKNLPQAVAVPLPDAQAVSETWSAVPLIQPQLSASSQPELVPPAVQEPLPKTATTLPEPPSKTATPALQPEAPRPNNPEPATAEAGPKIDIPLTVDAQYYGAKELDVQPRPLRKIEPAYPTEYESRSVNGHVILEMRVEHDGALSDLKVVEVSPAGYDAFSREALAAFKNARFIPARRKGQQVRALFRVKVLFEVRE